MSSQYILNKTLMKAVANKNLEVFMRIELSPYIKFYEALGTDYQFWEGAYAMLSEINLEDAKVAQRMLEISAPFFNTVVYVRKTLRQEPSDEDKKMQKEIIRKIVDAAFSKPVPRYIVEDALDASISKGNFFGFMEIAKHVKDTFVLQNDNLLQQLVKSVVRILKMRDNELFVSTQELEFEKKSDRILVMLLKDFGGAKYINKPGPLLANRNTLLHVMASAPMPYITTRKFVNTLIEYGADPFMKNMYGNTPYESAQDHGYKGTVKLMKDSQVSGFQRPIQTLLKVEKRMGLSKDLPFDVLTDISSRVLQVNSKTKDNITNKLYRKMRNEKPTPSTRSSSSSSSSSKKQSKSKKSV